MFLSVEATPIAVSSFWSTRQINKFKVMMFLSTAFIVIIVFLVTCLFLILTIVHKLNKVNHALTEQTKKMQKQLFISLAVQVIYSRKMNRPCL